MICPVCDGSRRQSVIEPNGASMRRYNSTYSSVDDKIDCLNCGGQTMSGNPTGQVPAREDGTPCKHSYICAERGTWARYRCAHCGHNYDIDSGD